MHAALDFRERARVKAPNSFVGTTRITIGLLTAERDVRRAATDGRVEAPPASASASNGMQSQLPSSLAGDEAPVGQAGSAVMFKTSSRLTSSQSRMKIKGALKFDRPPAVTKT